MIDALKSWNGQITINDKTYNSVDEIKSLPNEPLHIVLGGKCEDKKNNPIQTSTDVQEYCFTVKGYMCKKATPEFDFMAKWNNDNPMPMRTMVGTIEKETKGMVYLNLHGKGIPTITCMRCGRELKNPISRHYGIGPECISKLGFSYGIEDETEIKEALVDVTWQGWCIKSSIVSQEKVN